MPRYIESTLEEWKQRARESTCVHKGEYVDFTGPFQDGIINAVIRVNQGVFIGAYFTQPLSDGPYRAPIQPGRGWIYDDKERVKEWVAELEKVG